MVTSSGIGLRADLHIISQSMLPVVRYVILHTSFDCFLKALIFYAVSAFHKRQVTSEFF